MMGFIRPKTLNYAHLSSSPDSANARRWLVDSIWGNVFSIVFSAAWQHIRWAIPDPTLHWGRYSQFTFRLHELIWGKLREPISFATWWWLWLFPAFATVALLRGILSARGSDIGARRRALVIWATVIAMLAWLSPFLAEAVFALYYAFGRGPWVM